MSTDQRYSQIKKVTLISVVVNFLLGLSKLIGGLLFNSHALVADGIHSFSDLLTDAMVLFASKYGGLDADKNHPYGHQRIETAATLFLAMLLILAGAGIAWDALDELINAEHLMPGWLSLPIICVSIIANELLFQYTRFIGVRIQSNLLITNAWHQRSDAASSAVVLVGVLGSLAGFVYFDAIAACIVGIVVIKMGVDYGWDSVKKLVDTAVEPNLLNQIKQSIEQVHGVEKIHQLRSRLMGGDIFIDVHILVEPELSVSEGHYIAQHVHDSLIKSFKRIQDVTVHVDPEDDEICCPSVHLPDRKSLEALLNSELGALYSQISYWTIHYHDGTFSLDLILPNHFTKWEHLNQKLQSLLNSTENMIQYRILCLEAQCSQTENP